MDINSTNFQVSISKLLSNIEDSNFLYYYQNITRLYLEKTSRQGRQGLLIYHGTGMGKTLLAVSIMMDSIRKNKKRKYIILTARSLAENIFNAIHDYAKRDPELMTLGPMELNNWIRDRINFVSSNASNMDTQLKKMSKIEDRLAILSRTNLDDTFIVVDEAHNLFRSICNGAKNSLSFYKSVMESKGIQIIFLSGTPMNSIPFELVPCFNMIVGFEIFPMDHATFDELFVGSSLVLHRDHFLNRISGLVSHASYETIGAKLNFPKDLGITIVNVPMTPDQYIQYETARSEERGIGNVASSSYRVKSRQLGNYSPPAAVRDLLTKITGEIPESIIQRLGRIISPKYDAIRNNLKEGLSIIYSQFVGLGGLQSLSVYLTQNGISKFKIISGEVSPDIRASIIEQFNQSSNSHGENIQILLLSSTGAEGIDLKNVRYVHILEPYWNYGRIKQVRARAIRNNSHIGLPEELRTVQTYIYIATCKGREKSSDQELYDRSLLMQGNVTAFEEALKEGSFDCTLLRDHYKTDRICHECAPTDKALYKKNIFEDLHSTNTCQVPIKSIEKVQTVSLDGTDYKWKKAAPGSIEDRVYGYDIFYFNKVVGIYQRLELNSDLYERIVDIIKKRPE